MLNPIQTSHSFQVKPETEDMDMISPRYMSDEEPPKTENKDPSKHESESAIQDSPSDNETPEYKWEEDALLYISESIQKTGERKVDSKLLEDFKSLEKLELSEKKKKVEELQKELKTIKTKPPRLFEELNNEVEKLITQIERETNTVSALTKHHTTISEIIAKIEDPEIYKSFEEKREQEDETFRKDPTQAIIAKILADDPKDEPKIDEEFKKLFEADPDSITKIITPIVKENAIQKIITEIKLNASQDPQTEDDEFDSFGKIIEKILAENSLITKYYKKDHYSIAGIIYQLQSKKTGEKIDEDPITKITTRILDENAKASQAIKESPAFYILIAHEKETSKKILSEIEKVNLSKKEGEKKGEIKFIENDAFKNHLYISPEIVQTKILTPNQEISSKVETEAKKPSFFSQFAFFSKPNVNTESVGMVLVKPYHYPTEEDITKSVIEEQKIEFIRKIKDLDIKQAEKERSFDVTRLLIYAKLIDKIPQEYSESISSIHQEIISLKKQEKDHKKTLVFLTPIIIREEEEEKERKRIAEGLAKEIAEELAKEIAEEFVKEIINNVDEEARIAQEKLKAAVEEEQERKLIRPSAVKTIEEQKTLQEKIRETQEKIREAKKKLDENSKTKEGIKESIKEILSPEYVDKKLAHGPKESIMDQLIIEAIIVDEAKKQLGPYGIREIEVEISEQSSDNIPPEAFNLLVLKKALEINSQQSEETIDVAEIFTQQNIDNFFSEENKLFIYCNQIYELEDESKAIKEQIYELEIALTGKELALPQVLALEEVCQASWVSAQQISVSFAESKKQPANPEESGQDKTGLETEKGDQDYPLLNQGAQSPRSFGAGFIFGQTDLESGSHSYQTTTHEGQEKSVGTFSSDDLLGGGVVDQNNLQQFQNLESLYQGYENEDENIGPLINCERPKQKFSTTPPLALPPQPSIEEQVSLAPLTTVGAVTLLKKMLEESSRDEEPEDTREVVRHNSWQSSGSFNGDQSNFNHLNHDHLLADQSSQQDQENNTLTFSEHSFSQGYASDEQFTQNTGQVLTTASLFNQALEDNKKKEIEEKKIKKSFSNLFLRCLLEKMESPVKENIASSEQQDLSAESNVPEEITLNQKEIFACNEKVSNHLASEYQKLLEKLKPTRIEGLQDDRGGDDKQSDQSSQDIVKTPEPFEDPKIYCGVGIRMALEKETIDGIEQNYLKIVEIFKDSALSDSYKNQKISAVEINENGEIKFKSITDILKEYDDIDKFYAKISTIFHNPLEGKISLKFKADSSLDEDQKSPQTFTKKLFRPDKNESLKMTNIDDIKYFTSNLSSNRQISNALLDSDSQKIR